MERFALKLCHYGDVFVSAAASMGWLDRCMALRRPDNWGSGSTEHTSTEATIRVLMNTPSASRIWQTRMVRSPEQWLVNLTATLECADAMKADTP